MIHYLYVKTHSKTGLKYLGKTTQDPYKYKGSGKYWRLHLNKHGEEHDTTILHECKSNAELMELGLHYSTLWNVVESREWANLKPEYGDGGSQKGHTKSEESVAKRSGDNHPNKKETVRNKIRTSKTGSTLSESHRESIARAEKGNTKRRDKTLYTFENVKTGERVTMLRHDFIVKYGAQDAGMSLLLKGKQKTIVGWRVIFDAEKQHS
jgi:hypothetical protein